VWGLVFRVKDLRFGFGDRGVGFWISGFGFLDSASEQEARGAPDRVFAGLGEGTFCLVDYFPTESQDSK